MQTVVIPIWIPATLFLFPIIFVLFPWDSLWECGTTKDICSTRHCCTPCQAGTTSARQTRRNHTCQADSTDLHWGCTTQHNTHSFTQHYKTSRQWAVKLSWQLGGGLSRGICPQSCSLESQTAGLWSLWQAGWLKPWLGTIDGLWWLMAASHGLWVQTR